MSIGWIKLHRKLLDSRVFANEGLLRLWIYCLCRANHEPNYVDIYTGKGKTEVKVNPGEFIFGRKSVSKDLKVNPSTLYKRMQKLENIGNINIQSNTHYSIVSICNWDIYQNKDLDKEQGKEQPSNNQVTGKEQPSNTDKNDKNVKNEKNISPLISDYSNIKKMEEPLTKEQGEILIKEYGKNNVEQILLQMENWKPLTKKNKSANLTAQNWLKRNNGAEKEPSKQELERRYRLKPV